MENYGPLRRLGNLVVRVKIAERVPKHGGPPIMCTLLEITNNPVGPGIKEYDPNEFSGSYNSTYLNKIRRGDFGIDF